MKRLLSLLTLLMVAVPLSAQVLVTDDFEDGTYSKWTVWNKQENAIVGAENAYQSNYAYEIRVGTFIPITGLKANSTYRVSFYIKSTTTKNAPKYTLSRYDPDQKKLVDVRAEFIEEISNEYKLVSFRFDTKKLATTHRVTLIPASGGGRFAIDNFVVEKIQQYQ